ncbi:MAG: CoA transferase [Dehalococcoidales bacterium]|nr:CoA transferase [Dehalococcoidales bacterium]
MSGVLEGLKVIAMEHMEAIPVASVWMADWGAEVIKIEPLTGDMFRGLKGAHGMPVEIELGGVTVNWTFQLFNRGKKSIALNLKTEKGKEILAKLVESADCFLSNYTYNALEKLGTDYESVKKMNPSIVYATISGYGSKGPDSDQRGFDHAAGWARAGMQFMIGEPGSAPPRLRGGMIDRGVAAPQALSGILAALWHREKTGEGQELEISLFNAGVWTLALDIQAALVGTEAKKDDRTKSANPLYNVYPVGDGRWFQLSMLQSDPVWPGFCKAIQRPELENDPKFNSLDAREKNCEELIKLIEEEFAKHGSEYWDKIFRENDLIFAKVQSPMEVAKDPQALAMEMFTTMPHPNGDYLTIATPVKFTQNPAEIKSAAPEIGQDGELTLIDAGYSWEDIIKFKDEGVIL